MAKPTKPLRMGPKPPKVKKSIVERATVMTPNHQSSQKASLYPGKTNGSEVAAEVRKKANNMTETERAEMFERGMRIIYGGNGNCSSKVRS